MRKISEQCRRTFSAILAAVMVLTSAPGTTMTAMAAEQTDAIETVVDSEEITLDDTDSPDDVENAVLDGEEGSPDKGIMDEEGDLIKLNNPVIEMTPEDGKIANRGEASFKISGLQSNSQVYYVIGDKNVPAADVKDPTAENASYLMSAIEVSAPDTDDEATVVVKAISIPTGSYAANYTSSDVVVETFTFAAKDESQDTEVPAAPGITFKVGEGILAEGSTVPFGTKVSMELTAAEGANIYYTLDGKFPTKESTAYNGAIELSSTEEGGETITVRAIAVVNDKNSEVAMSTIVFAANAGIEAPTAPTITFKNGDDVLEEGAKVAFGTKVSMELAAAENAEIFYTIDGNNPTEVSARYTEVVGLSSDKEEGETVTVKAIAVAEGKTSEIATASVTFEEGIKTIKIDFVGDWNTFSCNLVPGDSDKSAHWVRGEGYILANKNSILHLEVSARDNFKLKSVLLGEDKNKISNNKADFWFTATQDTTITVNTVEKGVLGYTIYDSDNNGLQPKKNGTCTYVISPRAEYRIVAHEGTEDVVFEEAKLTDNKNKPYVETKSFVTLTGDNKTAVFSVGTDLAGKTCKVVLKHEEHISTLIFEVAPILTKLTIAGVKDGSLSQAVGETKSYALTYNPKNSKDEIGIKCDDESGAIDEINIIEGKLSITTAKKTDKSTAKIILYNKTSLGNDQLDEGKLKEVKLAEFTVNTTMPAWAAKAPTVKQAGATDTDLILNITAPKTVELDDNYYYEVTYQQGTSLSDNSLIKSKYIYATDECKRIKVIDRTRGYATNFAVSVKLVWTNDGGTPTESNIICESTASKTIVCRTKRAYYADKITLKKGTTTIYSGQANVQVATIDYGRNTTYIDDTEVIVKEDPNGEKIRPEIRNGKVYIDVDKEAVPGKYTIHVMADAEETMVRATADLSVNVVAGISGITATGSTDKIYVNAKKNGKANVTVSYGEYNQMYKPKSAKFTYTLGRVEDNEFIADKAPLGTNKNGKSYVTVNNKGVISVNKGYQINNAGDEDANRFAVEVRANDYKCNDESSYVEFTVVNTAQKLGELLIIDPETADIKACKDEASICASMLEGGKVIVVNNYDKEEMTFSEEDVVDTSIYTLGIKGKGITVDGNGIISVQSIGTGEVSFIAKTKDGGGITASLKFKKVTYDSIPADIGLTWRAESESEDVNHELESISTNSINKLVYQDEGQNEVKLQTGDRFDLRIIAKEYRWEWDDEEDNQKLVEIPVPINKFRKYSLSVSGGAKIVKDYSVDDNMLAKNQVVSVVLTGKDATVTVKGDKVKRIYKLTSEGVEKEFKAPTVKSPDNLVVGKTDMQTLTFKVIETGNTKLDENVSIRPVKDSMSEKFFDKISFDEDSWSYNADRHEISVNVTEVQNAGNGSISFIFTNNKTGDRSAITKPVKIKAINMKKDFKPTNKYTLSVMDLSAETLTYTGNNVKDVEWTGVLNANEKGRANRFTEIFDVYSSKLFLQDIYAAGETYSGYIYGTVTYEDDAQQGFTTKITVKVLPENKTARSYKVSNVAVVKNVTTVESARVMPVVIKAGSFDALVADVAEEVYDKKGNITDIKASCNDDKVFLDLTKYIEKHKKEGVTQDVYIKILTYDGFGSNSEINEFNPSVITLKLKVIVPSKMEYKTEATDGGEAGN